MSLAFMLFAQAAAAAAAAAPAAGPPAPPRIDFDLARYRPAGDGARACAGGGPGPAEVVVCGPRRHGGAYPMAEWARIFATRPLVAEMGIAGNVRGDIHGESVALDRGAVSNRVMVRLRLPF